MPTEGVLCGGDNLNCQIELMSFPEADMIQVNVQRGDKKKRKKMQAAPYGDIYSEHLHLHTGL